jgi:NAD(P)-dependent dehydrogenase (short-subunit alcohol dehydrogenase family)
MNWHPKHCAVIGANGGIGATFISHLLTNDSVESIHCCSRSGISQFTNGKAINHILDYDNPESIAAAAAKIKGAGPLDLVIVATGLLHDEKGFGPEKSLRQLDSENLARAYQINAIGPALVSQSFLPLMNKDSKSVFAALSARVGSISDNNIGGWYGYRAAKAGLNQLLRTASIEHARRWPESVVIGLHPGTVDTDLSKPFQRNVADGKLFTAEYATEEMLKVISNVTAADTGKVFAYDGKEVPA